MTQNECANCNDYLSQVDFGDLLVCPVCWRTTRNKLEEACKLLKEIGSETKDMELVLKIKTVLPPQ